MPAVTHGGPGQRCQRSHVWRRWFICTGGWIYCWSRYLQVNMQLVSAHTDSCALQWPHALAWCGHRGGYSCARFSVHAYVDVYRPRALQVQAHRHTERHNVFRVGISEATCSLSQVHAYLNKKLDLVLEKLPLGTRAQTCRCFVFTPCGTLLCDGTCTPAGSVCTVMTAYISSVHKGVAASRADAPEYPPCVQWTVAALPLQ